MALPTPFLLFTLNWQLKISRKIWITSHIWEKRCCEFLKTPRKHALCWKISVWKSMIHCNTVISKSFLNHSLLVYANKLWCHNQATTFKLCYFYLKSFLSRWLHFKKKSNFYLKCLHIPIKPTTLQTGWKILSKNLCSSN